MIDILLSALVGLVLVYSNLIIFQDYFVARHFRFCGSLKMAKIVDLQKLHMFRADSYLTFVEYQEEGKLLKSVVQMSKKDKVGDNIAILVSSGNYTVRYNRYIPYHLLQKILITIFAILLMGGLMVECSELLGISWNVLAIIFGGVLGYLYYPKWVYDSFFRESSALQKILAGKFNYEFYGGAVSLRKIGKENEKINRLDKIVCISICGIIVLEIIIELFGL